MFNTEGCEKTRYGDKNDTQDINPGFHPRFFCKIDFPICSPHPYSYASDLSFKIRIWRSRDWYSYWGFRCLLLGLQTFYRKSPFEKSRKKHYDRRALLFAFAAIAYFWAQPFWPFLMVRFIQGIGFAFYSTASFTFIANISQAAHLGQSLSYFFLAPNLSLALVPALGIFLINHFSFNLLFLVCLGLSLSSLFITNKLGKRESCSVGGPLHRKRFLFLLESSSAFYHQLLYPHHLGSLKRLFPSLCHKSRDSQSRVFLHRYCHNAYFGSCFGWEDIRPL